MGKILIFSLLVGFSQFSLAQSLNADVKLSPAGSFKVTTDKITGFAKKTADGVVAQNVEIDMKSIQTGISLRDKHTKERLMVEQFPKATLVKAVGKGGKGLAHISIKGKKIKVAGTYEIKGDTVVASFPMKLSELDITGVKYMGVGVKDGVNVQIELPLK